MPVLSAFLTNERDTDSPHFMAGLITTWLIGSAVSSLPFGFFVFIAFPVSLILWALGILILGCPSWWLLTRLGWRSRAAAMALGFGWGAGVTLVAIGPGRLLGDGLAAAALPLAGFLGLCAAGTSGIGWGVAYRPNIHSKRRVDEVFE